MPSRSKRNVPRSRNAQQANDFNSIQDLLSSTPPAASGYDSESRGWASSPPESGFHPEPAPEGIGGTALRRDSEDFDAFFSRVGGEGDVRDTPRSMAGPEERLSPVTRTTELLPESGPGMLSRTTAAGHQIGHTRTPVLAR